MSEQRILHCWEGRERVPLSDPCDCACGDHTCQECMGGRCYYGVAFSEGATCLLERGHAGEHKWTLDSNIAVRFSDDGEATP